MSVVSDILVMVSVWYIIRLFTERQLQNGLLCIAVPHCIVNTVIPVSVHSEIFVIIAITSCFKMKTWYNAILNDG